MRELECVSHREFCTGFFFDHPLEQAQLGTQNGYIRDKAYFATALDASEAALPEGATEENENGRLYPFIQRNKVSVGDECELLSPHKVGRAFRMSELLSEKGEPIESAPHPSMVFFARVPFEVKAGDILRAGE